MDQLRMKIMGREVQVEWENNTVLSAITNKLSTFKRLQLTKKDIRQIARLSISVPRNDRSFITSPGDIVIQDGNNLVIFMGETNVSATKIGHLSGYSETQIKNLLTPGSLKLELYEA